ncbi:hypothetical protein EDD29_2547 [Actinocorallia herbida]|uniref:Tetratricopeptide repeat protein n=1 Tax=Actinocorallia herbida TaxID=58109 RepID=A0A3N1CUP1_9ACTN|nr:hypothetical protein [Actinocorallia herbida]ROO85012.1 hypothetical protein EDD29_2547 [Actinocorallia herbida]
MGNTLQIIAELLVEAADVPCDPSALLPSVEAMLAHSARAGSSRGMTPSLVYRSEHSCSGGHLADSVDDGRQAWEIGQHAETGISRTFLANVLLKALTARGEYGEAAELLGQVRATHVPGVTPSIYATG